MRFAETRRSPGFWLSFLQFLTFALMSTIASAQLGDQIFTSKFNDLADGPYTEAEAARFLTRATFGPTPAEITRLRQIGYRAWLNEQFALPATLTLPWLDQLIANPNFSIGSQHRVDRWMVQASTAPDQLRQRMAFALSQIIVVSDVGGIDTRKIANFQDMMTQNAFGTYRNLLGLSTFHPAMAEWLTYVRNRAQYTSGANQVLPDENYAREIMQLFSFGLVKRNLDFSLTGGTAQPTYDNTVIANLAKAFTGLTYASSTSFYNSTGADQLASLWCFPMTSLSNSAFNATGVTYHDLTAKPIFDGLSLPAVTTNTRASCESDINNTLDIIANHASVAPFISRQLIQRFVTSNPSPAYIQRVASVFNNNGSGVRGDLQAVLRQILLDDEALQPSRGNFGKLRDPLLRMTAIWRGLDVVLGQPEPATTSGGAVNSNVGSINMSLGFATEFGQRPWSAPSVFNFFVPDFQNPGPIDVANLFSPEFQVLNESTISRMNNTIRSRAEWFVGMTNPSPQWPLVQLDALAARLNPANSTTYAGVIDELNARLMQGQMSGRMRTVLLTMLGSFTAPTTDATRRDAVRRLIRVIVASPEFAVQK